MYTQGADPVSEIELFRDWPSQHGSPYRVGTIGVSTQGGQEQLTFVLYTSKTMLGVFASVGQAVGVIKDDSLAQEYSRFKASMTGNARSDANGPRWVS